jgi:hypothetical protein
LESTTNATVSLTVTGVNDPPTFIKGSNQMVNEDSGTQTVNPWATSVSVGAGETGTVTFDVTTNNNPLFSTMPAVNSSGVLTYTPATNANGSATVSVTARDSAGLTSSTETFTILVNAVNDQPDFTSGGNQTEDEDASARTVTGWATGISSGPSDESDQTVSFTVTNTNNGLFSTQPAVDTSGTLTYTLAANANGSATVSVTATDTGSGVAPNVNSRTRTFTITVTAVNDAPSFVKGGDQMVNEDAGAQTVNPWATSLSRGPSDELAQTLNFSVVTNSNSALFSVQPVISSTGVLTYTPAANAAGSATITIRLTDNGSSVSPNVNVSATQDFVITVNPVNDAPTATATSASVNEDSSVVVTLTGTDTETSAANLTELIASLPSHGSLVDGSTTITEEMLPYALPSTGQVTYVPTANYSGSDSFTFRTRDRGQPDNCAAALIASTCSEVLTSVSAATVTLSVAEVNDPPTVNLPTNTELNATRFTYDVNGDIILDPVTGEPVTTTELLGSGLEVSETSPATVVDAGAILTDDSVDFKGGSLTVEAKNHSAVGSVLGDRLEIRNQGTGAGQIGLNNARVLYGGVQIGTFAGGGEKSGVLEPLVITFNTTGASAAVTQAAVQALLRNITFRNDATSVRNPAETRTLFFTLNDGGLQNDPTTSATSRKLVYVSPVANAPTITPGSGPFTVLEQAAPFLVAPSATLVDLDTTNFSGATLTIDYTTSPGFTGDQLTIRNGTRTNQDPVGLDGGFVYHRNLKLASWRNGDDGASLVIRFVAREVTDVMVRDVIQAIQFQSTVDNPQLVRVVRFDLNEGTPLVERTRPTVTVNVTPVNDAPSISLGRSSASYTEDNSPTQLTPSATVTDPDSSSLSGPTLTVRFVANGLSEDLLAIRDEGLTSGKVSISGNQVLLGGVAVGTWSGGTSGSNLVVSFTGATNVSTVEAVARNVTYRNTSQAPSTTSRTIGFVVADGSGASSSEATFTMNLTAVNDAPVNTVPSGATVAEDNTLTLNTASGWVTSIADVDAGSSTVSVTLTATDGQVTFDGTTGTSVTKTGTLTALNTLLNGFLFTPDANFFGTATITVLTSDLGATGIPGALTDSDTFNIVVTPVNDAPTFSLGTSPSVLEDSGANTFTNWVTAISPGPREGSTGQTVSFVVTGNTKPGLFSVAPAIDASGTLTFTPTANLFDTATITVKAVDTGLSTGANINESAEVSFTITIEPVNDAPSFVKGSDVTVDEDTLQKVVAGWASAISSGPPNESDQVVSFSVSNDNTALFSAQPAVDGTGQLTFTPAPDAFGSASVSVKAVDNGNSSPTKLGDTNESASQLFTIFIEQVNDKPSVVLGPNVTVDEDAGAVTETGWVASFSRGINEDLTTQVVSYTVVADNTSLFEEQPAISSSDAANPGELTFTPKADEYGSTTVTVTPVDDGNTGKDGEVNTGESKTFTITIEPVNDEPSFMKGLDQTVDEDSQEHTIPDWATLISTGPYNESTQSVTFTVINDNNTMFAEQPAISPEGELTYKTAADAFGTANVTVVLTDDGDNDPKKTDDDNATDPQTFVISFGSVNDAPSFTLGTNPSVLEDAGVVSLPAWVTDISSGPANEGEQTVTFEVTVTQLTNNNYAQLFATAPAISSNGTLTFTPAANAFGDAKVKVKAIDSGPGTGLDVNESIEKEFTIIVEPVNDAPTIDMMLGAATVEPPIQYSDSITPVSLAYGDIDTMVDEDNIRTSYTYQPPAGLGSTAQADGLPTGLSLQPVVSPSALAAEGQVRLTGRMMVPPGSYTITVMIDDGDPLGALSDSVTLNYEVIKETVDTSYTGDPLVMTAGPTTDTASVLLRAQFIQKDAEAGSYFVGAADQVRVRWQVFRLSNNTATPDWTFPPLNQPAVPIDASGRAQLQVPLKVDGYAVRVVMTTPNTYWTPADIGESSVTVDFGSTARRVTGGGWVADTESRNGKGNFGFTVAPQRNGTIKGQAVYMFKDAQGFTWKVKTTSWQSGSLTYYSDPGRATFVGKAVVQKIDANGNVVESYGNWSIVVGIFDGGSGRTADRYGIEIKRADGTVWRTIPGGANVLAGEGRAIGGGNIIVYR